MAKPKTNSKTVPHPPPPVAPNGLTQKDLAVQLGVSARQVRNLIKDHGMPATWPEASAWYLAFKIKEQVKRLTPKEKSEGDRREQELKNRLLELEVAQKEGRSIPTQLYRTRTREQALQYAGAMRSLGQYSGEFVGLPTIADAQEVCERVMNRILAMARGDDPDRDDADVAIDQETAA